MLEAALVAPQRWTSRCWLRTAQGASTRGTAREKPAEPLSRRAIRTLVRVDSRFVLPRVEERAGLRLPAMAALCAALWWVIRASSSFGWIALAQIFLVVPWLCVVLMLVTSFVARKEFKRDRSVRVLYTTGSILVLLSAVVGDLNDNYSCFLGTCTEDAAGAPLDPWWAAVEGQIVDYTLASSSICAGSACLLFLVAIGRKVRLSRQ